MRRTPKHRIKINRKIYEEIDFVLSKNFLIITFAHWVALRSSEFSIGEGVLARAGWPAGRYYREVSLKVPLEPRIRRKFPEVSGQPEIYI